MTPRPVEPGTASRGIVAAHPTAAPPRTVIAEPSARRVASPACVAAGGVGPAKITAWRLLRTPPRRAAWNMAVDHALAERVGRGESQPVLRFYAWDPPAVSIGYNQPVRGLRERLEALRARGIDAVRRPTGGRAVLHADEVTYSVIAPRGLPALSGGALVSCARIHAAILAGLESLGIGGLALHASPRRAAGSAEPHCFASPSRSEITWRGRKLVGSAQRRLQGAILQHGSILLSGDQSALERVWPGGPSAAVATLAEADGRRFTFEEVARAVCLEFGRELGATPEPDVLDPEEEDRVESLVRERYGRADFLYRA